MVVTITCSSCYGGRALYTAAMSFFTHMYTMKITAAMPAAMRPIGGLGIFMVKKSMDEVSYRYEDGQNIFTMRKKM